LFVEAKAVRLIFSVDEKCDIAANASAWIINIELTYYFDSFSKRALVSSWVRGLIAMSFVASKQWNCTRQKSTWFFASELDFRNDNYPSSFFGYRRVLGWSFISSFAGNSFIDPILNQNKVRHVISAYEFDSHLLFEALFALGDMMDRNSNEILLLTWKFIHLVSKHYHKYSTCTRIRDSNATSIPNAFVIQTYQSITLPQSKHTLPNP
jgi:hypothetical protein